MKRNYIYPKVESAPVATAMHLCEGSLNGTNVSGDVVSGGNTGLDLDPENPTDL